MAEKKTNAMRILEKHKIPYEMLSYHVSDEHVDAISVAYSLGEDICFVYKTLVLQGSDKSYYVCVINGADELDLKKAARACVVKNLAMIPVSDINKITGYIRGGCSPIGMKKQFKTVIDKSAEALDQIIVSAGKRGMQIKLTISDLIEVTGAGMADIIK